jgi:hypothetical protein
MNIKTENQLRLQSLISHRIKIAITEYPPEYTASRENMLKILDGLIYERTMELQKKG